MLLFMILLASTVVTVAAAAAADSKTASANYNPYQYDLTVPQFTPDGRLLQTEYAQAAADHSTPVVAALLIAHEAKANLAVLACCRRRSHAPSQQQQQQQARLILLPSSIMSPPPNFNDENDSSGGNHASTTGVVVVALAGVLADSLSLLQAVQDGILEDHRKYGGTKEQTAAHVATLLAAQCQTHQFGGGIRPLGSTIWVTSCNSDTNFLLRENDGNTNDALQQLLLQQTDPSGALRNVVLNEKNRVEVLGGGTAGSLLQRRLQKEWSFSKMDDSNDVRRHIGQLLTIMVDEHRKSNPTVITGGGNTAKNNEHDDATGGTTPPPAVSLEVVLLSPTKGALKLTNDQIQSFLQHAATTTTTRSAKKTL